MATRSIAKWIGGLRCGLHRVYVLMDRVEEASVLTMLIRLVSVIDGCVPSRM